jgi:hypothetical protein
MSYQLGTLPRHSPFGGYVTLGTLNALQSGCRRWRATETMNRVEMQRRLRRMYDPFGAADGSGIIVGDREIAALLGAVAEYEFRNPCCDPECSRCELMHTLWWDLSNSLSSVVRVNYQNVLKSGGIPLPAGPSEVVG